MVEFGNFHDFEKIKVKKLVYELLYVPNTFVLLIFSVIRLHWYFFEQLFVMINYTMDFELRPFFGFYLNNKRV